MQFAIVKEKPPETLYTTRLRARAKRREVALGRPGYEPVRIRAWLFKAMCIQGRGHPKAVRTPLITQSPVMSDNDSACSFTR
jgi:hypothetical protein